MSTEENPYAYYAIDENRPLERKRPEFDFGEAYTEAYLGVFMVKTNLSIRLKDGRLSIVYEDGKTFQLEKEEAKKAFKSSACDFTTKLPGQKWYHELNADQAHIFQLNKIALWAVSDSIDEETCVEKLREMFLFHFQRKFLVGFVIFFEIFFCIMAIGFLLLAPFAIVSTILAIILGMYFLLLSLKYIEYIMKSFLILAFLAPITLWPLFPDLIRLSQHYLAITYVVYSIFAFIANYGMFCFLRYYRNKCMELLKQFDENYMTWFESTPELS